MTPEHKLKMAEGRRRAAEAKRSKAEAKAARKELEARKTVGLGVDGVGFIRVGDGVGRAPQPPAIDYDLLAAAMLRAQARARTANVPPQAEAEEPAAVDSRVYPPVTRDDRGMPVDNNPNPDPMGIVAKGDNPVRRILSKLTFPPDKEQQVVAMIAANLAPSWDANNGADPNGAAYPPVHERLLVAHMQEYCMTLRPELPKTRLEPKYRLHGETAAMAGTPAQ